MLARLPSGLSVFIDTNIFVYHFLDVRPVCSEFFQRLRRDIRGYTSTPVVTEVLHKLILSEVSERNALTFGHALRRLRRQPEIIGTLTKSFELVRRIFTLGVRIVPLHQRDLRLAIDLSQRHHLLATDSVILATMQRLRLVHLVSNDTDFATVSGITLWRP